jgi:hypothetical protein
VQLSGASCNDKITQAAHIDRHIGNGDTAPSAGKIAIGQWQDREFASPHLGTARDRTRSLRIVRARKQRL